MAATLILAPLAFAAFALFMANRETRIQGLIPARAEFRALFL